MPNATADRFWVKVDQTGECWLWTASKSASGYGRFALDGTKVQAHRFAYEALVGPIPEGLQLDHLCRVRNCVKPAHLEPVTPRENTHRSPLTVNTIHAARTQCPQGHGYTPENTRMYRGKRYCRECARTWNREYNRRKRQAA